MDTRPSDTRPSDTRLSHATPDRGRKPPLPDRSDKPGPYHLPLGNGRFFPILGPAAGDIDLRWIAEGLGKLARFAGQTPGVFYSVAQHSLVVEQLLPETPDGHLKGWGLLHDAHEFVTGDIVTPTLRALGHASGRPGALLDIQRRIDDAILTACGLPSPRPADALGWLQKADRQALATEARDLMPDGALDHEALPDPAPFVIKPLAWDRAMDAWLARIRVLALTYGWRGPAVDRLFEAKP